MKLSIDKIITKSMEWHHVKYGSMPYVSQYPPQLSQLLYPPTAPIFTTLLASPLLSDCPLSPCVGEGGGGYLLICGIVFNILIPSYKSLQNEMHFQAITWYVVEKNNHVIFQIFQISIVVYFH